MHLTIPPPKLTNLKIVYATSHLYPLLLHSTIYSRRTINVTNRSRSFDHSYRLTNRNEVKGPVAFSLECPLRATEAANESNGTSTESNGRTKGNEALTRYDRSRRQRDVIHGQVILNDRPLSSSHITQGHWSVRSTIIGDSGRIDSCARCVRTFAFRRVPRQR